MCLETFGNDKCPAEGSKTPLATVNWNQNGFYPHSCTLSIFCGVLTAVRTSGQDHALLWPVTQHGLFQPVHVVIYMFLQLIGVLAHILLRQLRIAFFQGLDNVHMINN